MAGRRAAFAPRLLSATLIAGLVAALLPGAVLGSGILAADDTASVAEDAPATTIDVLANDTTPALLTITDAGPASNGTVEVALDGKSLTYKPAANYNGPDSFSYSVTDGTLTDSATVSVTVTPVDDAPVAVPDSTSVRQNTGVTSIDVLANDTDIDTPHAALRVTLAGPAAHGSVTILGGGTSVGYQPTAGYSGPDSFGYTVSDGTLTASSTVSIAVVADRAPVATADATTVAEDSAATTVDVLANDSDPDGDSITIVSVSQPAHGTVVLAGDGLSLTYEPTPLYSGPDAFGYTISDGVLTAATTVAVTVSHVNHPPTAVDDSLSVPENAPAAVPVHVLANDSDKDADPLTVLCPTEGDDHKGAVTPVGPVGAATDCAYKPFPGAFGSDAFTYTLDDGHGGQATALVTVTITSGNHPPVAHNDFVDVPQAAGPTPIAVLTNDTDPDGNTLTIVGKTNGAHGVVTITGGGTGLSYDPTGTYQGPDVFTYTISDGVATDTASVAVTVVRDTTAPTVTAPVEAFVGQTVGSTTTRVRVRWTGHDVGVGVARYTLQVSVNGRTYTTVTLGSATSTFADRPLTTGATYRFRVRATDGEGNVGAYVYGPLLHPVGFSESSSVLSYTGSWTLSSSSRYLGGKDRSATSTTRRVTFRVQAWDVSWVTTRLPSSGKAQVWVDGVLVTTIDLRRSSSAWRQLVFSRHFATLAIHTIEIRIVGTGRVDLDGFLVMR